MSIFTKEIIKEVIVEDKTRIDELQAQIQQLKSEHESEKRILNNELKVKINEAIEVEKKETVRVAQENAVLKKEVEILSKAFENMGFDVKDMKEILNKLVDGIVSKNEINVIK